MERQWFAFFSMLFWCCTKIAGLGLCITGLVAVGAVLLAGFDFWQLLLTGALPLLIGFVLLRTEIAFDLATTEQERRTRPAKDK